MKLMFAVLDVPLTMGLTRCYKTCFYIHYRYCRGRLNEILNIEITLRGSLSIIFCVLSRQNTSHVQVML